MLGRIIIAYMTLGKVFGVWFSTLVTFSLFILLRIVVSFGMVLDYLFFPRLWQSRIKNPIIIVGNPRTGTTFLHRFMVSCEIGCGLRLWNMLFPSLLLQIILRPAIPFLEKIDPARHHDVVAHKTGLTYVETEDPAILFRYFNGLFLYGFILAWAEKDLIDDFDPEKRETSDRDFEWFDKIWRRNLIANRSEQVVAKIFSLCLRIPCFLEKYPDAKLLYMVRDPLYFLPSTLSLVTGALDNRFGFWKLAGDVRQQYIERLYRAILELNIRFHADYTSGRIPLDKIIVIGYDRIINDFEGLMEDILNFTRIEQSETLKQQIKRVGDEQRKYKSMHKYDLAKFGLTEERVKKDFAFFYETFASYIKLPGSGKMVEGP